MPTAKPWTWKNLNVERDTVETQNTRFQLDIFDAFLKHDPENLQILMELGSLYTQTDQIREGLKIDQKLVKIQPEEPIFRYNLACSHSLLGEVDQALDALKQAVELGYRNLKFIREDSDLENLRNDKRFDEFLNSVSKLNKPSQEELH